MILKASQRSGGRKLGHHLLNANDNEQIEVHEIKGFMSDNVLGAMNEARAISLGTKCKQYLFSLSLSPPETENVRTEVFEKAIERIEERLGLKGQPRIVVFHEKEGRRHCHAVWSRIDAKTMKAKQMSHFKMKLFALSREFFLENGWKMPGGYIQSSERSPVNFSLAEWQQSKRAGLDPRTLKAAVQDSYAVSKDAAQFSKELEARGLYLAKGDRRAHVVVTHQGEVFAVSGLVGNRTKDVAQKIGNAEGLRTVDETREHIAQMMAPRLKGYIEEAKRIADNQMKPLNDARIEMKIRHREERQMLDEGQKARHEAETKERAARLPRGIAGIWHRLTGQYAKIKAQNELEAFFCLQRDRAQRDGLVNEQLKDRQELQERIEQVRDRHERQIAELYRDASSYSEHAQSHAVEAKSQGRDMGRELSLQLG